MIQDSELTERDLEHIRDDTIDFDDDGGVPLAARLHHDGTIRIYVQGEDSGLSVGLEDDGTLWVRVDESKRAMKVATQ